MQGRATRPTVTIPLRGIRWAETNGRGSCNPNSLGKASCQGPGPLSLASGTVRCSVWSGTAGPCTEVTEDPRAERLWGESTVHPDRTEGLDTATNKPALRGKGNGHTSGTQVQTGHPTGGWSREVRRKDDTSAAAEPLGALTRFPTTACLLSLAPCLPLPALPPCAPHSSPLPRSLLSVIYATEQGLTATHHPAPSSWLQSH